MRVLLCLSGGIDSVTVAAMLKDLKQRGLLDDTLVVFCTEFGRTPAVEERSGGTDGRDHHPHGFTVWLAGAGVKRGYVHGATDELGFHAIEPGHYVTDLHATVLPCQPQITVRQVRNFHADPGQRRECLLAQVCRPARHGRVEDLRNLQLADRIARS